ncbi:MAG: PhnD/SsuA/transferrin family substrate-binding protein [Puniceicoccaceae bacterium]
MKTYRLEYLNRPVQQVILIWMFWIAFIHPALNAAADTSSSDDANLQPLNVVFDRLHFSEINHNDAVAALTVLARNFSQSVNADMDVEISSYDTADSLIGILDTENADLVIIHAKKYFQIPKRLRDQLEPIYITRIERAGPMGAYHLLAPESSGISGWADVAGKELLILKSYRCHLTSDWFKQSLEQNGVAEDSVRTETVDAVSNAILPVFFGKADACVVSDEAYVLMKELNPQIGKKLLPVETSPSFAEVIICLNQDFRNDRQLLIDSVQYMHLNPSGEQVMMLFKISQLVPFEERFLDNVQQLLSDTNQSPN